MTVALHRVLSVSRPNLLGQIVRGTSNHATYNHYGVSPKAVETLNTWKMLFQIFFSLCVKDNVCFSFS